MQPSAGRGNWSSRLGFVLAAAGSAIGLGNIWRFPYTAGENGGGAFVLIYLACVLALGLPVMLVEISLGRATQKNPVGAIRAVRPTGPWQLLGFLAIATGLGILSYYAVIAGQVVDFFLGYVASLATGDPVAQHAGTGAVIAYFAIFLVATVAVVAGGVQRGIERWTKILMPLLLVIMAGVIVRGLMLPGAWSGVAWFLTPDFSKIDLGVVLDAMAQAFFSLSLGMGAMLTYGSYLSKREDVLACAGWVVVFDTGIAIAAGFMIFPAVFALGHDPAVGTTLIFEVLPGVFSSMTGGVVVGGVFFLLLCVAALTSTVSLLEVVTSYFVDERGWSRRRTVWTAGTAAAVVGLPSALNLAGVGPWDEMEAFGQEGFLAIMDFLWGNVSLVLGALMLCLFTIFVWGLTRAGDEIASSSPGFARWRRPWAFTVKWVCPIVITAILLTILLP